MANKVSKLKFNNVTYDLADESSRAAINNLEGQLEATRVDLNNMRAAVGSPLTAATTSAMTNTSKVYVYTGTTTTVSGVTFTAGNWYYHDGTKWQLGGTYNETALETDTTLTVSGAAADAKVTGDKVTELKSAITKNAISKNLLGAENGILYPVFLKSGETFTISTKTGSIPSARHNINLFDEDGIWLNLYQFFGDITYRTITLNMDVAYICMTKNDSSQHITTDIFQLERGSQATSYENYFKTAKTLTNDFLSLNDTSILESLQFEQGTCTLSAGRGYSADSIKNRLKSKLFALGNKAIVIKAKSGYQFAVMRKVGNGFVSTSGWVADQYLLNDRECFYCIIVKSTSNTEIGFKLVDNYIEAEYTDDDLHGRNLVGMEIGKLFPLDFRPGMYITMSTADESNLSTYVRFDFYGENITERVNYLTFTQGQKSRTWQLPDNSALIKYVRMYTDKNGTNAKIQLEFGNTATEYSEYKTIKTEDIPNDYYLTEMSETISSVKAAITEPCLVFPLITDIHMSSTNGSQSQQLLLKETIRNIKWFVKNVNCDFVLNLGDNSDGNVAKHFTVGENAIIERNMKSTGLPYFFVLGNHDTNYYNYSDYVSFDEFYSTYFSPCHDVIFNPETHGTEYYIDFDVGVRLVVINANYGEGGRYAFSSSTGAWLSEKALDTENIVLLCSHLSAVYTQNWNNTDPTNSADIISAIQGFINSGGIIVQLCGHSHCDYAFTSPWTNVFSCCNKCQQVDVTEAEYQMITGYVDGLVAPERSVGTVTEDCWSVVVVKPTSRKINLIRFGAGSNREYTF